MRDNHAGRQNERMDEMKVTNACHRIEELWNETEGKCYVSFSGGKDSTVVLALIKLCQDIYTVGDIPAVFSDTGIEMGVTVDFVRWVKNNWYPNVEMIRPEHSFDWCVKNYGKPIKSKLRAEFLERWQRGDRTPNIMRNFVEGISNRGLHSGRTKLADKDIHMLSEDFKIPASPKCCSVLKKKPFLKYARERGIKGYAYGVRSDEGGARALNYVKQSETKKDRLCTSISGGIIKKAVIIDWSDEDVETFIKEYKVPLSDAYTKYGFYRTGCMLCPFAPGIAKNLKYLFEYEPNRYKASMHWLKDVYIAQDVRLPFDEAYERERECGRTFTSRCGRRC